MSLRLFCLALGLLAAAAVATAGHPVLESFGLPDDTPLSGLVLMRGPGEPPPVAGLEILARRETAFLARLEGPAAESVTAAGWLLVPLADVSRGRQDMSPKTWIPVTDARPDIQAMVDRVDWTTVIRTMSKMMRINSRYSTSDGCRTAADTLQAFFDRLGLNTQKDPFQVSGATAYNVVATQTGTVWPDSTFVICAHYDATSESPLSYTPGADDNATGTAAVMLAAQLLSERPTACTVKYVCFAGEEQGLVGSNIWVQAQATAGAEFAGALNFDMLGWWTAGVHRELEVEVDPASQWLGDAVINAAGLYVPGMTCLLHVDAGAWWGDHASFWGSGYCAVNHEESWDWGDPDFNPNYHSTDDELQNLDIDFTVENIRIAVAAAAMLADPQPVTATRPGAPGAVLGVAPNPASGSILMRVAGVDDGVPILFQVVDLRGRVVAESTTYAAGGIAATAWRPDPVRHPAGTYLVRLRDRPDIPATRVSVVK